MTISPDEYRDFLKLRNEQREEFRREIERHVEPYIEAAHKSDQSAIELGQSTLKTSTLLNGGALVAIPAVVTLFGIETKSIITNLLIAGGLFALGLIFCWLSGCGGFFAMAHRADRDYSSAEVIRQSIYMAYHQTTDEEKAQYSSRIATENKEVTRHNKGFVRSRTLAIAFSFLSLAALLPAIS
jgi:hypothetical protein